MSEKNYHPPKWVLLFLQWFCPDYLYEEIEGDLIQKFNRDVKVFGERKAKRRLVWNVIRFFRPGIVLRNKFSFELNQFYMVRHFFKIFFRTTIRDGAYSFINIAGMAVGLTCCIFISLWVIDETSYDQFNSDGDQIYQVIGNHRYPDRTLTLNNTPSPLAGALKELPEVMMSSRVAFFDVLFQYEKESILEKGIYADSSITGIFTLTVLEGNRTNLTPDNNSVAISSRLSKKYFKDNDAIGKVLKLDNKVEAKVTAVFQDLPSNSTNQFDFILPFSLYSASDKYATEWGAWTGGNTFVKLTKGASEKLVNGKIATNITKPKIWPRWDSNVELFLFPLRDWRLHNQFNNGVQDGGRITFVKGFSLVALFILLMACINFMNLSTARSMTRTREVGVRKAIGAQRSALIRQFIGEATLLAAIALCLAVVCVYLLLPWFNNLTGKKLLIDYTDFKIYGSLIMIIVFTGLAAGSYPAFFISSVKVIDILKGKFSNLTGSGVRKTLVVFQFSLSLILIVGAIVVYKQIDYMRNKDLGFDKENILYVEAKGNLLTNYEAFRLEALQQSMIINVAAGSANPMDVGEGMDPGKDAWPGKVKEEAIMFGFLKCDPDFLTTLNFTILDGRNFSKESLSDTMNFIVNEEAVKRMHLTDPVGQNVNFDRKGKIVGVVKDFHSTGLQKAIDPIIIAMRPKKSTTLFIRYAPGKTADALAICKKLISKYEPNFPVEMKFMDQSFGTQYQNEILIGKLSAYFTLITIFIAGLGLFGLASFTAERRRKEIGVRKVMGASVWQVVVLLCKDFVFLLAIAFVVGFPIAWWGAQKFLNGYAFHTALGVDLIVIVSSVMLVLALLAVSFQSVRAALADPVKSLKTE